MRVTRFENFALLFSDIILTIYGIVPLIRELLRRAHELGALRIEQEAALIARQ